MGDTPPKEGITYRDAGVDIDRQDEALRRARESIRATFTKGVLGDVGAFGGLYDLRARGLRDPILVSSADGVGTKLKAAHLAGRHDSVGRDLVNHCVNDILVQGAQPLFFLDYVAMGGLEPEVVAAVIEGVASGCRENDCALLGGETAEMPGLYPEGEYDLAGFIVGACDRTQLVTGEAVRAGDVLIAFPSVGLHTNGYSLARKILFDRMALGVHDPFPGALSETVGDFLLREHPSYLKPVEPFLGDADLHGMVHITGGGLPDNLPRVLRDGLQARVDRTSWTVPNWMTALIDAGGVPERDAFRTFNMGVGYVMIIAQERADAVLESARERGHAAWVLGDVRQGDTKFKD